MQWRNTSNSYGAVAKFLHWSIVILIIAQYVILEAADELPDGPDKFAGIANHKSFGMLVLGLALARIGWKLVNSGQPAPRADAPRSAHRCGRGSRPAVPADTRSSRSPAG